MATSMILCVLLTFVLFSQSMRIKRSVIPHNAKPGFLVSTVTFWGQKFSLDDNIPNEFNKYFDILSNGDLITNSDIAHLIGSKISLFIKNELATESWQESVHISVQDAENMLVFPEQRYEGHISENLPAKNIVNGLEDIFAKPGHGDKAIHYSLASNPNELFELVPVKIDGIDAVQVVTTQSLDREQNENYDLILKATVDDVEYEPAFANIRIKVEDENDNFPEFEDPNYSVAISEDTPALATITTVKAVDPDEGNLHYVMNPSKAFKVDQDGHVIIKSRSNLSPGRYSLFIYAEDDGGKKSQPVTVDILVEGTLHFEPKVHSRKKRAVRPPKEVEVPESTSGNIIDSTTDDNERATFKEPVPAMLDINQITGVISVKADQQLDYETEQIIEFTVLITDASNPSEAADEQPIRISISDVNDEIPKFVNVPRPFLATVSTNAPPGTSVYQLMASDKDKGNQIKYILESGGEDRFEVDPDSGVVRTKNTQPFRQGKEYEIGVSAQDVASQSLQKSSTHSLKILVGQRDPQFFETQYTAEVPETAQATYIITEIKAYSHQGFPITYTLTTDIGSSSNEFAIKQDTGEVDLLKQLDFENDAQQYYLKVMAVENGRPTRTSTVNLIIDLVDENDNSPTFPLSQYIVQGIAETVLPEKDIIQVTATDLDSVTNSQLTYSVNDDHFTVKSINNIGFIKTAKKLDYDYTRDHTYNFTVTAMDNGTPARSGTAMVMVTVTNVNDEDPIFSQSIEHVQVSEDAGTGTVVHVVQAYDPDGDLVTYTFVGGGYSFGPFSIQPNSGIIKLVGELDKSQVSYKLNITATDNGGCCGSLKSRTSQGLVIVEIKDINNNAPTFPTCGNYNPTVFEREDIGTSVFTIRAEDGDTGSNGNVTYSMVKQLDQDSDRFTIDPITGVLRTADIFDREPRRGITLSDVGVTVKAEDQGSPRLAGFCTFRIKIGDKNDNDPVFDFPSYSTKLEESSNINKKVIQVYATDKDAGANGNIRYSIDTDPSGFFDINPSTGWITVGRAMSGEDKVDMIVRATDEGEAPRGTSTVRVTIEITQTVNSYPQFEEDYSAETIELRENTPVNFVVKKIKAFSETLTDTTVNYVIQDGDTPETNGEPQSFYSRINDSTNVMDLLTYRPLDYETVKAYTLTIKASNRAANSLTTTARLNIQIKDANDEIPQFVSLDENGRYSGAVAENVDPGARVIAVTATDKDEVASYRDVTYKIKTLSANDDSSKFRIDAITGEIFTTQTFDREGKDEYYITVVAEDGAPSDRENHYPPGTANTGEAEVQIRITDKNDNAPFFAKEIYEASVPENSDVGAIVIMVTAEDEDEENQLTYSIVDGNVGNVFEVVPELGEIKIRGNLDFESSQTTYNLLYRVFDDKFENSATVVVRVTDVNDNAPRFTESIYNVTEVTEEDNTITENNSKWLLTVQAKDPDVNRQSVIRYSLTGQFAQDGTFIINENTGEIYLTRPLDRDPPRGRPVWNFNVLAHDEPGSRSSLTGYAEVRVMPKDVNDNAPVFDRNRLVGYVAEHTPENTPVLTVIATDVDDGNNGSVTYSLKQADMVGTTRIFDIDSDTGLITTTMSNILDREDTEQYEVIVQARDKGSPAQSSSATVTVIVTDINDQVPKFTESLYKTVMSESYPIGASITSVSATDKDTGTNARLTYRLKDSDREFFSMNSVEATNTGVLKVYKPVDYDRFANRFFNLTVYVRDSNPTHEDVAYIEVEVTDANDNPPKFEPSIHQVLLFENASIGTPCAQFSASDLDTGLNAQFTYAIDRQSDPLRQFSIDVNGWVSTIKALDRETTPVHRVGILAIDKGTPPMTGTGTMILTLKDNNDNHPIFAEDYRPVIYENTEEIQQVVVISATDKDTTTNGPPFVFKLPPNDANPTSNDFSFDFTPGGGDNKYGSGTVKSKRTFDREKQKYYYMPIIMIDSGNPPATGTNTLTITIGDRNDNPHFPGYKEVFVYNYKGLFANVQLGNVHAEDEDDWDVADKEFSFKITSGADDPSQFFDLDRDDGSLTLKEGVREGTYTFEVKVYDKTYLKEVISTVSVTVQEISDDAVANSASIRFTDMTAEEFVERPKTGTGSKSYGLSKYDLFRQEIAGLLSVPTANVDIFTVLNHPTLPRTTDVRFSAHGSPYYRPARLNGLMEKNADSISSAVGVTIGMVPIDECYKEICESGGCANRLVTTNDPLVVNTNATSLIGVTSYIVSECVCAARTFDGSDIECSPTACANGGTCHQRDYDFVCECLEEFDGPRCQQTRHSFDGSGWAWYKPLAQCEDSRTSLEFITTEPNGLILFNGPTDQPKADQFDDFIVLELRSGYPTLRINHGSGQAKMTIDGRDTSGIVRLPKLNDGRWHKIDISREGKLVTMTVDDCETAAIVESETQQSSTQDRKSCEVAKETPGESKYLNVKSSLQLGGRENPKAKFPEAVMEQGFDGCIKNLIHNGELYDLHIGNVGEHLNSQDGCPREDSVCGSLNDIDGPKCGVNGTCIGSFGSDFKCICDAGYRGQKCATRTTVKSFEEKGFIEWDFKDSFYNSLLSNLYKTEIQLMFRSRQDYGMLFKAENLQKSEYMILEIDEQILQFRYNLGSGEEMVTLTYANVSDGHWHTAKMRRIGKVATLQVDSGEGRFYNETLGSDGGHLEIRVRKSQLYAGGDVKFPSSNNDPIVTNDFFDSCMDDIRYDEEWFPMMKTENSESRAANVTQSDNLEDDCKSELCLPVDTLGCLAPLICTDLWRYAECRCPIGQKLVAGPEVCVNINECEELPGICNNGICTDTVSSFFCTCDKGFEGDRCNQAAVVATAAIAQGAVIAIVICLLVLLLLILICIVYSRRRRPNTLVLGVDPDDDIRENIIHYDEEGVGEEDQDAYDINRLKKPIDEPAINKPPTYPDGRRRDIEPEFAKPVNRAAPPPNDPNDVGDFIHNRMDNADDDPSAPPHDSIREYAYEGGGSDAGSLSSLASSSDSGDQDYNYLNDWGPRFSKLADMYGAGREDDE